ncbi:carotenoid ester lipase precursor [Cylindrobasidium torrendii FP15055 ss-10]|uniref:Carboxylic ester hydrolase n=1 Tax=Cylindrobasidium torrendii FP15055 ss-10 TaxID=1314674 RepID=A0A0D7BQI1_9AGAR|nr:carotenoid ester lipase precursor [Cylindrobasidium torrendii FP15055 ss-10]
MLFRLVPFLQVGFTAAAVISGRAAGPTVTLDGGSVVGTRTGAVDKFLGIPFGKAPVGDLRFNLPEAVDAYSGTIDATSYGPSCPQQALKLPLLDGLPAETVEHILNSIFNAVLPSDEDCLTINVVKPSFANSTSNLPVVAWIFGGGFELGGTSMYDGASIVARSIAMGKPIIYVSMAYRVSAFGFLASQEVKDAGVGNAGLHDQRLAFKWIQKYIGAFGGDKSKVTIWGESAGAISVALHMISNGGDTEGLFRAGFMQSGSPIPVGDLTGGQKYYDDIADKTGCSGAADSLQCLREVDYNTLKAAVDDSPFIFDYQSLLLAWLPRADGVLFSDNPQRLVQQGKIAHIPIVSGDCDDEGTLFSLAQLNVTTNEAVRKYIQEIFLPKVPDADIDALLKLYPQDITQGSPFDTGIFNAITPQFKRIASFQGDAVFQAPRRYFFDALSGKSDIWAFANKRLKGLPVLGSFHASDILNVYGGGDLADYLINFVVTLDPTGGNASSWPKWTSSSPNMLSLNDIGKSVIQDTYRKEAMAKLNEVLLTYPV